MREIKFRGKAKMTVEELEQEHFEHENGWFYGNLIMYGETPYIVGDFIEVDQEYTINEFWIAVHPESVGQFIGLTDKNGKEIYEGDVVQRNIHREGVNPRYITKEVAFINGAFGTKIDDSLVDNLDLVHMSGYEVIGNIYENPKLLEVD